MRSKLVLLLLHFPRLRVLWSRTPAMSAALFRELKAGRPDPDAAACLEEQAPAAAPLADTATTAEVLLHVPGITERNLLPFVRRLPDGLAMAELARLDPAELARLLGSPAAAAALHRFLSFSCPP